MHRMVFAATVFSLGILAAATPDARKKFYSDDPLWAMPRPVAVANPAARKLNEYYDFFENTLYTPGDRKPRTNEFLPSQGINTVDEVPDSAWYTNRHATRRMSPEELQRGPGNSTPPAPGKWLVVAAKNEGVTPGFRIRDGAGHQYLIKFDPLTNPEMASAADVITSRFFYALGYNVPENYVVYFDRNQIAVNDGAMLKDETGRKRPIRAHDIDAMLAKVPRRTDGRYRALASRLISGKPIGPFRYYGTRSDDPNDLVSHEHRRDLRALRTFCAWLGHDDSKALNTLDVLTEERGISFIQHYLIDFGASLGSATFMANSPRDGNVYLFDWKTSAVQFFTFGLYAPHWQHARYPKLPAVGRFEYDVFDPQAWVPDYPNTAFRNENPADRLWAARKILAFNEEDIRAIVATGQYTDPAAEEWVVRCLVGRRKKVLGAYLKGMGSLDGFQVREGRLEFQTSGPEPVAPGVVHVEWSAFDNATGRRQLLPGPHSFELPQTPDQTGYLLAELTGPEGPPTSVFVRTGTDRKIIVGVERHYSAIQQKSRP